MRSLKAVRAWTPVLRILQRPSKTFRPKRSLSFPITRISYNISKETRIRFLGFFNPFIVLIHIIFSILSVTNQNLLIISLYPFPFQSAIPYSFFSCFPCLFKEKTTFCILFELFSVFFNFFWHKCWFLRVINIIKNTYRPTT